MRTRKAWAFARWFLQAVEVWLPQALLLLTVVIIAVDVVLRYGFNNPMSGATEIAKLLFIWMVFIGGAAATTARLHIGFEALPQLLGGRAPVVIRLIGECLIVAVLVLIVVLGVRATIVNHSRNLILLGIPYSSLTAAIPVGCTLMAVRFIERVMGSIREIGGVNMGPGTSSKDQSTRGLS